MKAPANCRLIGRWRIVEADLWDRAHLDLCGPASADDHRPRRRNRLRRLGGRPGSRICPRTRLAFTGPAARKATRSRAKGPPNSSTTALSRSSSHTETATKPSSKRNGILLQQPARGLVGIVLNCCFARVIKSSWATTEMQHPTTCPGPPNNLSFAVGINKTSAAAAANGYAAPRSPALRRWPHAKPKLKEPSPRRGHLAGC